jgi:MFS family permease
MQHGAMCTGRTISPARFHVLATIAVCVANHAAMTGSRLAVSLVGLQLGVSAFGVGVAVALFAIVPMLGSIWLGRWIDHMGARRPALAGISLTCAGLMLPVLWLSPATLALAAVAVGAGYAMLVLAVQHELGLAVNPGEKARALSAFAFGTAISSSLGPLAAGACLSRLGARPTFALGCTVALFALLCALFQRGWARSHEQRAATTLGRIRVREVLADKSIRSILLADLLMAVAWNANTFVVPIQGTQQGWPADAMGRMLSVFGAAVLMARALPATWRLRASHWATIRLALASSGACLAALPLCHRMPALLLIEAVMGVGLGGALSSVLALLHEHAPACRVGEVFGLRLVALNASAIALPVLLGWMTAIVDLKSALWGIGLTVFAGMFATLRVSAIASPSSVETRKPS